MNSVAFCVGKKKGQWRLMITEGVAVEDVDKFLTSIEIRGLSPRTIRAYAFDLLVLYRWLQQKNITAKELNHNYLLDFIKAQRQTNSKPTSINRRLIVTGLFYRFLTGEEIRYGAGASFPARHYKGRGRDRDLGLHQIKAPLHRALQVKTHRSIVEPLTAKQAQLLIGSFRRYRDISMVYLMLLCGLRSREVLNIKLNDIEFNENYLRVWGKGNKERIMPLPTILLNYLHDYIRLERPSYCRTKILFVILQGKNRSQPMTAEGLRNLFRHRRKNENIKTANPHRLRHTFGADMARSGVRLPILQKMMGHADAKTTLQYINLSMADISDEFNRASKEINKRYTKRTEE